MAAVVVAVRSTVLSETGDGEDCQDDDDDVGLNGSSPVQLEKNAWEELRAQVEVSQKMDTPWRLLKKRYLRRSDTSRLEVKGAKIIGLDKCNLIERLEMEERLSFGLGPLVLWFVFFVLLQVFLLIPKDQVAMLGIQTLMTTTLGLDTVSETTDVSKVWSLIQDMATASHKFIPSSSDYLVDNEYKQLVGEGGVFIGPVRLLDTDPLLNWNFSITAWVRADLPGAEGFLVKKFIEGQTALSCWGFHYPGSFRFGSHDLGLPEWGTNLERVVFAPTLTSKSLMHHYAVVVSSASIAFYRDAILVHAQALPRPVTDCTGTIAVGDAGLEISDLRLYPRALQPNELTEIILQGHTLLDLVKGVMPSMPSQDASAGSTGEAIVAIENLRSSIKAHDDENSLTNLRRDQQLRDSLFSASAGSGDSASSTPVVVGTSFKCFVASPCRLHLVEDRGAPTSNFLRAQLWGVKANTQVAVPDGSGIFLAPADRDCAQSPFSNPSLLRASTSGLAAAALLPMHNATAPCSSGADCDTQLQRMGLLSAAWSAIDIGVPNSTVQAVVCFFAAYGQETALRRIGTLSVASFPGFVQVSPDMQFEAGGPWQLFPHPVYHTRSFDSNSRFSLSFWARIRRGNGTLEGYDSEVSIGLLRMYKGLDLGGKWCWNAKMYASNFQHYGGFHQPDGNKAVQCFLPEAYRLNTPVLRHVAWVFDDHLNGRKLDSGGVLRTYLDGKPVCVLKLHYSPQQLECPGQARDFMMTYWSENWYTEQSGGTAPLSGKFETGQDVMDSRFFPEKALTDEEVAVLADSPLKECVDPAEVYDTAYADVAGHGCLWYREMRQKGFNDVCDTSAREACPIACNAYQFCYPGSRSQTLAENKDRVWADVEKLEYEVLWDRHRLLKPRSLCLSSSQNRSSLRARCEQQGLDAEAWAGLDITDCGELEAAIDPDCTFNATVAERFSELSEAAQEYTIAFWAKGPTFISTMFSVHPPVFAGRIEHPNYVEARQPDDCAGAVNTKDKIWGAGNQMASEKWEFYAISAYKTDSGVMIRSFFGGVMNAGGWGFGVLCNPPLGALFLNAERPTLVSPIRMWPKAVTAAELFILYYDEGKLYKDGLMAGPRRSDSDMKYTRSINPLPYRLPLMLLAPPLLFTQRGRQPAPCQGVGAAMLDTWADRVAGTCKGNRCSLIGPSGAAGWRDSCRSETGVKLATFYDRKLVTLQGSEGFAEFLTTLTASLVMREGLAQPLDRFVDQFTEAAEFIFLGMSPSLAEGAAENIVTILRVRCDFAADVDTSVTLDHLQPLPRSTLVQLVAVGALAGIVLLVSAITVCLRVYRYWSTSAHCYGDSVALCLYDFVMVIVSLVVLLIQSFRYATINDEIDGVVHNLVGIPWGSGDVEFEHKVDTFFSTLENATRIATLHARFDLVALIVMGQILIRVIVCFNAHPRLSLITGTILNSLDSLWHFFIITCTAFVGFAVIGCWFFGHELQSMASIWAAMQTEYYMALTGEMPEGWETNEYFEFFCYAFKAVLFFVLMNILLAILVEGYMEVAKKLEKCVVEQGVCSDIWFLVVRACLATRNAWPSRLRTLEWLKESTHLERSVVYAEVQGHGIPFTSSGWVEFFKLYSCIQSDGTCSLLPEKPDREDLEDEESLRNIVQAVQHLQHEHDHLNQAAA